MSWCVVWLSAAFVHAILAQMQQLSCQLIMFNFVKVKEGWSGVSQRDLDKSCWRSHGLYFLPRPWTVLCRLIVTFLIMPSQPTALHSLDSSLPRLGFEGGGNWWQLRLASAEEARGCSTLSSNLPSCPLRGCHSPAPPL